MDDFKSPHARGRRDSQQITDDEFQEWHDWHQYDEDTAEYERCHDGLGCKFCDKLDS